MEEDFATLNHFGLEELICIASSEESGGSCCSCSADGDSRNLLIPRGIEECCRIGFGKVPMVTYSASVVDKAIVVCNFFRFYFTQLFGL